MTTTLKSHYIRLELILADTKTGPFRKQDWMSPGAILNPFVSHCIIKKWLSATICPIFFRPMHTYPRERLSLCLHGIVARSSINRRPLEATPCGEAFVSPTSPTIQPGFRFLCRNDGRQTDNDVIDDVLVQPFSDERRMSWIDFRQPYGSLATT